MQNYIRNSTLGFRSLHKYRWSSPITFHSWSPAQVKRLRQRATPALCTREFCPRGLGSSCCLSFCAGGGHQHPSISHEWSNPFCQSTSWPKGVESARFPVCLVLTSWPWACLGACRAKLKAGGNVQELALSWMGAGILTWPWELCNPYSCSWGSKDLAKGATCLPDLFWSVRQGHQLMPPEPFSLVTSEFSNVKH